MLATTELLTGATSPSVGAASRPGQAGRCTVQAVGKTSSGSGSAVIELDVSNDGQNWLVRDTITLTLSASESSAGVEIDAAWAWIRAEVKSISGTGAAVTVTLAAG